MINKFLIAIAVIFAIAFVACEKKDTVFIKRINNTSSKDVTFYLYGNFNPVTYGDTIMVAAGELKEILSFTEENSSVSTPLNCALVNDSIRVEITGGGMLNKKLTQESDWVLDNDVAGNTQTCTFEITDADIL